MDIKCKNWELSLYKINKLQEENRKYKIENNIMKKYLLYQNDIKNLLRTEKEKNNIWKNLLIQNTNINIDFAVKNIDEMKLNEILNNDEIENFLEKNNLIKQKLENLNLLQDNYTQKISYIKSKDNIDKKRKSYRTIRKCIKLKKEELNNVNVSDVDQNINSKLDNFPDINEVKNDIDLLLEKLKESRIYIKILSEIKKKRLSIFVKLPLEEYKKILLNNIEKIYDVFKIKKYNDKKIKNIISKGLSSLESRIIRYQNYINSHLEVEDLELLLENLKLHINFPKKFNPYNNKWFCEKLYNYSIVVFPIEKIIKYFLYNYYNFFNIIYLPLPKSLEKDPYSFYILEKVNKNKRYWSMDCRLEELGSNISNNILPYMIDKFRKIYYDVFGDNTFRKDYNKTEITEYDCEQLIQNIILLSQPIKFCNLLRFSVYKEAKYIPTENDKFNLYGDDILQKKKFQKKKNQMLYYM